MHWFVIFQTMKILAQFNGFSSGRLRKKGLFSEGLSKKTRRRPEEMIHFGDERSSVAGLNFWVLIRC